MPRLQAASLSIARSHAPIARAPVLVVQAIAIASTVGIASACGPGPQGATLEEARTNLVEAVELVLEANRALARADAAGVDVIQEPLKLTA